MRKRLLLMLMLVHTLTAWCAVDDTFTAKTIEGIEVKFKVTDEEKKTVCVDESAISRDVTGVVTIPAEANGYTVTAINRCAFYKASEITSVYLPNTIVSIGESAFYEAEKMEKVIIPENVTSIANCPFAGCYALKEIVSYIKDPSKMYVGNLEGIYWQAHLIVPKGTKAAYKANDKWKDFVIFEDGETVAGLNVTDEQGVQYTLRQDETDTYYVVTWHTEALLTEITIPSSISGYTVKKIDSNAFKDCINLTKVTFSEGLTNIYDGAFSDCTALTEFVSLIKDPSKVWVSFGYKHYEQAHLIVPKGTKAAYKTSGNWALFIVFEDGETVVERYVTDEQGVQYTLRQDETDTYYVVTGHTDALLTEITIPSSISGYTVKEIDSYNSNGFKGCTNLTKVTFSEGLTSISFESFSGCTALTEFVSLIKDPSKVSVSIPEWISKQAHLIVPKGTKAAYKTNNKWKNFVIFEDGETVVERNVTDEQGVQYTLRQNETETYYVVTGHTDALPAEITIPSSVSGCKVREVLSDAFKDCANLTKVTFGSELTSITFYAFSGCTALTELVSLINDPSEVWVGVHDGWIYQQVHLIVPKGTKVAYKTNSNWRNFIIFEDGETVAERSVTDEQGVQYTLRQNETDTYYVVTGHTDALPVEITIPGNISGYKVKEVPSDAFVDCANLTKVTFSEGLTSINFYAFSGCTALMEYVSLISDPSKVSVSVPEEIYKRAHLVVPNGTKATYLAATGWKNFTIFEDGETVVERNVTDEQGVQYMLCQSETDTYYVVIGHTDALLTKITIPSNISGYKVKEIPSDAFKDCANLTKVTFGSELTSISFYAFSGCTALTEYVSLINDPSKVSVSVPEEIYKRAHLVVPNGTKVTYLAATGWKNFTIFEDGETVAERSVTDEQGVQYMLRQSETDTYYVVTGHTDALLTEITIPSNISGYKVKEIPSDAFKDCANLTKVTFSDGLTSISFYAFSGCTALTEYVSLINDPSKVSVSVPEEIYKRAHLVVPNGTKATYLAATGWKNFTIFEDGETVVERNVTDEQGVQYTLRQNETESYYAVTGNNGALAERVTLPEKLNGLNVTRIESNSFKDCTGMKWISIPECITDIPSKGSVFSGCSLTLALNQPLVSGWSSCDFITEVELGSKVDSLGYQAFYSCKNLTKVTYSEGLHGIGNSAFSGCTALSNVTLPESLVTLGESVFSGCTSIEEITIPKNVTMDNRYSTYSPFCGCTGLKSVTIHTQRFSNWFYGLTNIKKVYIGSEVTSFTTNNGPSLRGTQGTLEGCTGIEIIEVDAANSIFDSRDGCNAIIETATNILKAGCKTTVIPQTITSIGGSAFYGCIDLKEITIPTQVTSIGDNTFYNCTSLQGITIPAQVTSIGSNAFYGCTGLQTITSYLKKPFSISAFSSETLSSATLRIPFGRTKAYQATNGWGFQTIEEMEGVGDEISFIQFADAATKEACVKKWDENGDGEISLEEAKMVTTIDGGYISGSTEITSFDELKYFTNVTTIGSSAFSGCKALTSITIPNGVTSIGANAFEYCVSLATIVLPDSLTCIEAGTFKNCSALTAVTIPSSVTSIGNNAFEGCTNLSEINLPEGLLTIGEKAFYGSGLLEMTLPSTLTSIGNYSLAGNVIHCLLTTPISVGTLMYNASDVVLYVPKGCEQAFSQAAGWKDFLIVGAGSNEPTDWTTGVVTVKVEEPGGLRLAVVELDNEEISRLKIIGQLNSSDLQYLVEGNGKIANIESIDMSEVTLDYDGGCYYSGSSSGIGDTGFGSSVVNYYLTEEEHISTSRMPGLAPVTYYSYYGPNLLGVFNDKPYKHIVMPTSVKKAANGVFGGCKNLQSVEFPSGMSSIGTGAFSNCERLQSIDVQGIDTIPDNAFAGCRMLQSVDHMNNVKYIGSYAFSGCKMLQSIDHINNVDYIGKSAFYGCIMLNDIQFSENLTYIGEHAFDGCKTLPTVTLPSSLSSLSEEAFSNCSMLKQVIFSPELMQVDYSSFNNTPWLKSLPTENGIKYMGHIALCYDEEMKTAAVPPTTLDFREGTTYIADRFMSSVYYAHVQSITSIKLPTSLIKIGDNAFANAQISSLTLPENLEIIGARAFCNLEKLTKVTLSEKLRLIGDEAFAGCSGLTVVNYNAIKAAGDNLFNNCTSLEKVNVGAKVELLPDGIFAKCKSLTIVKFEERNNATPLVIGNSVFSGCENLSNIKLPGNTEAIGDAAFSGCSGLTTFTVPQGVSVVSGAMLSGCSGLTTVQLHEGITTIGDAAFNGCSKVASFSLPEKVDSIGASAFSGCYELKELTIPASVTRLGNSFVGDCYQLTRLVTKIREPQALSSIIPMSATIVQEVYHHYSNWSLYSDIHYEEVTLVVPDGCKQRYKDTDGWKLFKNVETESGNDFTDTNKFYVSENVVAKGHTTRMGINLVNSANDLVAYQVDLIVPLGFKITTNANGQYEIVKGQRYENNSHSITVEKLPDHQYATVNKYRIVCMSTSNACITGNDGLLLNVNLYASENYEEGDYKATLDNIIVSKSDGTTCELDYVPFNITVTNTANVLKGDANDDGEIDVADVVQTVNYILGRTPNVFARQNADVNEDGEINVGDLVGIVTIIANTYSDAGNNRAASPVEGGHLSGVLAADAATLRVENPQDFTAFQMLITLPWETDKEQFELKLRGASDHVVMTNWLSERQVMVVAYSVGLHSLAAGGNAFLQIVTDNAQKGEWKFEDIVFARANGTTCKFEPLYLSQTTGIGDEVVQDGKDERMYDLSGRPVMGNSLKKGLYIKGNKKILVK